MEDIDPAYAGIKSDSSDPGYAGAGPGTATTGVVAGKETHPYAVVNGIGKNQWKTTALLAGENGLYCAVDFRRSAGQVLTFLILARPAVRHFEQ